MIRILNPIEQWDGSHANLIVSTIKECPPDWAVVPDTLDTTNYPYGKVTITEHPDGYHVVTAWIPNPIPVGPTPSEMRENAYNSDKIISWAGEMITVTEASQQWQYYAAEGSEKVTELQILISEAKASIREQYPDEM